MKGVRTNSHQHRVELRSPRPLILMVAAYKLKWQNTNIIKIVPWDLLGECHHNGLLSWDYFTVDSSSGFLQLCQPSVQLKKKPHRQTHNYHGNQSCDSHELEVRHFTVTMCCQCTETTLWQRLPLLSELCLITCRPAFFFIHLFLGHMGWYFDRHIVTKLLLIAYWKLIWQYLLVKTNGNGGKGTLWSDSESSWSDKN